jgi:hypothetical protein
MVGMQTQFGRGRKVDLIANRTIQSGGSIGGVKKAGVFAGSVSWPQGNMGKAVFYRAPNTQPSVIFSLFNTTRQPTQGTNYGVYSRRGIMG